MKYVLLIYQAPGFNPRSFSPEDHSQVAADYQAVTATPGVTSGPANGSARKRHRRADEGRESCHKCWCLCRYRPCRGRVFDP